MRPPLSPSILTIEVYSDGHDMRPLRPICIFMCVFIPAGGLAVLLGVTAATSTPDLAPALLLSFGFLAFTVGVSAAARAPARGHAPGQGERVLAILDLRRNRARYALAFALLALAAAGLAAVLIGSALPLRISAGHAALTAVILFVAAWLTIGEAACSQAAIRRALLRERRRA